MARLPRVAEQASALRHDLGLGTGYVDVFEVLRRLGVEMYQAPFPEDSLEGAHEVRNGQAFFFVNSSRANTRQRLTAAHELGHHRLGQTSIYEATPQAGPDDPASEWDAYRFARYFLMDPGGVKDVVEPLGDPEERVAAVASRFVVSPEVAAIHLAELGHIGSATKTRLLEVFRRGLVKPSGFLARYGYRIARTEQDRVELDPQHVARSLDAYAQGWLTLAALADTLIVGRDEARRLVEEAGLEVREGEPA